MSLPILDLLLLAVMLVSGLLAMVRGFMREVLSISAWIAAALVTVYSYSKLLPFAKSHLDNDMLANAVVIGGVFVLTLIIVSIITIRISDMVQDSKVGALDRTLGFLFGLARGLLIVAVVFMLFTWLVNEPQRPNWVTQAKSRLVLQKTGDWLMALIPEDLDKKLKDFKGNKGEDNQADSDPSATGDGYSKPTRDGLNKLIDKPAR
ncbi:MAG: CvpA family protein [Alphaproteobacteria bacterium]|nr:CvpA family protein [Alphaproteobacteria bacterium]